jgi:hypothetical protein
MKLSRFFDELSSTYAYELEDLTYDSGGDDVLKKRLSEKRDQFEGLLVMCATDPAMVAPALHGGFRFEDTSLIDRVVSANPGEFPAWAEVAATLCIEPWADALIKRALKQPDGEEFLLVAAGLEYILGKLGAAAASGAGEPEDHQDDDDGDEDLGDAGEDWLGDQGFDRRS